MTREFFEQGRPQKGMTYEQYHQYLAERAAQDSTGLDEAAAERVKYTQLNLQRSERIGRTYEVRPSLAEALRRLKGPQLWMVLTEPWCGDSAQCLPYIAKLADVNPAIELRILLRDQNLDIMDQYLTGGSRGIPRLVAFGAGGDELFHWGPRPRAAQAVFAEAKAEGAEKPQVLERLHLWYGRNRGRDLEDEFQALLS